MAARCTPRRCRPCCPVGALAVQGSRTSRREHGGELRVCHERGALPAIVAGQDEHRGGVQANLQQSQPG
jgi:Fe-S-cluster-containing hydrogenase component 2